MAGISRIRIIVCFLLLLTNRISAQEGEAEVHNILYINSYAMTYTWADSLVSGIYSVLAKREDVHLYIEFLDAKRFDKSEFGDLYKLYKKKYRNIVFDVAIASDNDALDFMMAYADSLLPQIPIVFCGINNPEDYKLENSRYYGILDGIDLKAEIDLVSRVMPESEEIVFSFRQCYNYQSY